MKKSPWGQLTQRERDYLMLACGQGINPRNRLIHKATIDGLVAAELLQEGTNKKGRPLWRPTLRGLELIASRGLEPVFLHERSQYGYTNIPTRAMQGEPEVMDEEAVARARR